MTDTTAVVAEEESPGRAMVVDTKGLTKRFGQQVAVDDVTFTVPEGTIFGFIGPSGSGKTTTVRLMTGVQTPTAGRVHVWGTPPSSFTEHERARIGYMPQLSVLFPHLSIAENLRFVASIYGMPWGRRERLQQVLEFVELDEHRSKRLSNASGGMQRRLALAAALVNSPDLLFLDEPTAGIDPVLRRKFWDRFESLRDEGRTIFVTTQYVGEAAYCDRIAVLRTGRLLTVDTPDGLRRQAFGGEVIDVALHDRIEQELVTEVTRLDFVVRAQRTRLDGRGMRITVDDADRVFPRLQHWFDSRDIEVESIDRYLPPFDDVFVKLVEREGPDELDVDDAVADPSMAATTITGQPPGEPTVTPDGTGEPAAVPIDGPPTDAPDDLARAEPVEPTDDTGEADPADLTDPSTSDGGDPTR